MVEKPEVLATVDPELIFGKGTNDLANYRMVFGRDLAYMNGKLYNVAEYGEVESREYTDERMPLQDLALYSSTFRLISIDTATGEVENLGELPAGLSRTEDYTMAAYNGKLWFMGGYDFGCYDLTTAVKIFDPGKSGDERWSDGPALPEKRADGTALQVGSDLIYTLGRDPSSGEDDPVSLCSLIYNGSGWTVSSIAEENRIKPHTGRSLRDVTVGVAKNGLVYLGLPARGYGDTFVYNAVSDAYIDTGYNFIRELNGDEIRGVSVGGTIYGFCGEAVYTAPLTAGSGFPEISVSANSGGAVSGATVLPAGNDAVLTVKADEGFEIASIALNETAVEVTGKTEQTVTIPEVTNDQTLKVAFVNADPSVSAIRSATQIATEDGPACQAMIYCAPGASVTAYGARYDAQMKYLGTETLKLTPGESNEFTVPYDGADTIRIFAPDGSGAPACASATVPGA